jgi:type IV pilus assembly protein PilQ
MSRVMNAAKGGSAVWRITCVWAANFVMVVLPAVSLMPLAQAQSALTTSDNALDSKLESRSDGRPDSKSTPKLETKRYTGAPMNLHVHDAEVRAVLQMVAEFTQLNIVASDSVGGKLSLRLQRVPWDQVLDVIAQARGLLVRRQGNVVWVATRAEVAARDKAQLEDWQAAQNLEPLQTQSITLHYARAVEVQARLLGAGGGAPTLPNALTAPTASITPTLPTVSNARVLSPRGAVVADPRTNQLFITDVPARLSQVMSMLARMDVPLRQVMIEARIVQANDSFGQSLGVRLGRAVRAGVSAQTTQPVGVDGAWVNLPAPPLNGVVPAGMAVSIFQPGQNQLLNLELSALEADGQGKVVSSPRVVTADQTKAVIEQGTELPYQTSAGIGMTTIAFRKANLRLEVTPQITPEGSIVLDLDVHKDSVGQSTPAGFAIDNRHVNTQVRVDNGGTVMIGGIYETAVQTDVYKVPLLGDLPGVGALFRNTKQSEIKQELLVFITPKMLIQSASTP